MPGHVINELKCSSPSQQPWVKGVVWRVVLGRGRGVFSTGGCHLLSLLRETSLLAILCSDQLSLPTLNLCTSLLHQALLSFVSTKWCIEMDMYMYATLSIAIYQS